MLSKMEDMNPFEDIPADQIDPDYKPVAPELKDSCDNDALRPSNSRIGMDY